MIATTGLAAQYAAVAGPEAWDEIDTLTGVTGFLGLAFLIHRGARWFLGLADDLTRLTARATALAERERIGVELHNHLEHLLHIVDAFDERDADHVRQLGAMAETTCPAATSAR